MIQDKNSKEYDAGYDIVDYKNWSNGVVEFWSNEKQSRFLLGS